MSTRVSKETRRAKSRASQVPPELSPAHVVQLKKVVARLKSGKLPLHRLRAIWETRPSESWSLFLDGFVALAEQLIQKSEPFLGHDVAAEGLKHFPENLRLRQLQALALAQSGAPRAANRILQGLKKEGYTDAETFGLLARTHKDFWRLARDPATARAELKRAFLYYRQGFAAERKYYPGINAATLALILGKEKEAQELAARVRKICSREIRKNGGSYWSVATLAEACLIRGELAEARRHYLGAVSQSPADWLAIGSTRRQARLIAQQRFGEARALDDCFHVSPVVVFCGHMIDAPDRRAPRFPAARAPAVKKAIRAKLGQWDAKIGYSSAACGSDILFLEAMLERGGEVHVVLPFALSDFRKLSVGLGRKRGWGRRLNRILSRAASVTYAAQHRYAGHPIVFEYANRLLLGLAMLKSKVLETELRPLAVWDGKAGPEIGGTAHAVRIWRAAKHRVEILHPRNPAAGVRPVAGGIRRAAIAAKRAPEKIKQEIKAMLFADVVGYSKLDETEIPIYMECFMGQAAALLKSTRHRPVVKNTWGDAFYLVFNSVREAGMFALELRDMIRRTEWRTSGLGQPLNIRIGLHAGPVFSFRDPVLQKRTYTGSHVSRTARIEPIAEEGQIYASEPFAALSAAARVAEFACDYVGERSLAKKYGAARIYLVREQWNER
ncbi:MAG: DUF4071 domain-containing protein [Verrucomicrobia bacterium]|nr:DUF4071 domain-containing protein [Verrucomicrobiota bacterium]